ncbi:MAG: hypothetical protein EP332_06300 [Bacteroidetes bacterium]|nr:MAG: hypothetical protein EP332_06300 [Bacteroidota bacterium]
MALNGTQQTKLNLLRKAILSELMNCNETANPNLCQRISTKKGYTEVEAIILARVLKRQENPSIIIGELESEFAEA